MAKVALVTGAGSGIGRALALRLAGDGWSLALLDVDHKAVDETAGLVRAAGAAVLSGAVDVTDGSAVTRFAEEVQHWAGHVDEVFCVAGVLFGGDVGATKTADLERALDVNVIGSFNTAKAFLPAVIASSGRIVFVSSAFGLMAMPGYSAYCASKFAVRALAESMQQELELASHSVHVSCVYPGGVKTDVARHGWYAPGIDRAQVEASFDARIARTSPEVAAAQIVAGVRRGKRRIYVGRDARAVAIFTRLAGGSYPGIVVKIVRVLRR